MSWAAKRETTREEDMAYSLLGLFGVNMPMIYGEGKKAFRRLQLEIMRASEDHSIFAWVGAGQERGPLALHPSEFEHSGTVQCIAAEMNTEEYTMTNRGVRIKFRLTGPCELYPYGEIFAALLDCRLTDGRSVSIYLRQKRPGQFVRARCGQLVLGTLHLPKKAKTKVQELYFTQPNSTTFDISQWMRVPLGLYVFDVTYTSVLEHGFALQEHSTSSKYAVWTTNQETLGLTLAIDGSVQDGNVVFQHTESSEKLVVTVGIFNHQVSLFTPVR
jgi:hypothetical protein